MDIKCTQCGAKVPIETDTRFVRCPYCETALYVDADQTVRHYYFSPQAALNDLQPMISRKLSYMEIKDPVEVGSAALVYFPVWRFQTASGKSVVVPAAMPPLEDLFNVKVPAGDPRVFTPELAVDHELIEPEVMLEEAADEARALIGVEEAQFSSSALVHLPLFRVDYTCQAKKHEALVDAVSGEVYADDWPSAPQKQKDRALGLIALLAFVLFLLEAAALPRMWMLLVAYAATAGGIYALARGTLRKMGW
ncbi:MAG TPA: hypothetical protein VM658_15870 [bacterium]|nr:hypothetical protein [bacterium]